MLVLIFFFGNFEKIPTTSLKMHDKKWLKFTNGTNIIFCNTHFLYNTLFISVCSFQMNSHLFIAEDSDIMGFWISWDPFNTSCIIEFGDGFTKHGLYFCFGRYQQSQNYYNDFKSIKKILNCVTCIHGKIRLRYC